MAQFSHDVDRSSSANLPGSQMTLTPSLHAVPASHGSKFVHCNPHSVPGFSPAVTYPGGTTNPSAVPSGQYNLTVAFASEQLNSKAAPNGHLNPALQFLQDVCPSSF